MQSITVIQLCALTRDRRQKTFTDVNVQTFTSFFKQSAAARSQNYRER